MVLFKCPACKRFHKQNFEGDNREYICVDSKLSELEEQENMVKTTIYEGQGWNRNIFSTREDTFRDVTIIDAELLPHLNRHTGKKRGTYNY